VLRVPADEVLGIAGALLVAGAAITYLYDIVRGDTRPHRVSWLVWSCAGVLGFGAAHDAGAGAGAWAYVRRGLRGRVRPDVRAELELAVRQVRP
jgi:hypothetical protein